MANSSKTVVAIGKFDGVHIGHQRLLKTASQISKEKEYSSVALIINPPTGQKLTSSLKRDDYILSCGIEKIVVQNLTSDFMNMSAEDFVSEILLKKLNCSSVVVGYNFRFAKGRSANALDLKNICDRYCIECTIVPEVSVEFEKSTVTASSSSVREFLLSGNIKAASVILGRHYSLTGKVVHGKKIGRTINFPTANLAVKSDIVLPQYGVYATKVIIADNNYKSITNIGSNPTVNSNGNITVETHIIDFDEDIYEKEITVEFVKKIRDEKKFASVGELKSQIQKDIEFVLLTK